MDWVELGTARTTDLVEGLSSVSSSSGNLWNGLSLQRTHTKTGEIPEGYVLDHVLILSLDGPDSTEVYQPDVGWRRVEVTPSTVQLFPARMPYALRWKGNVEAIAVEMDPSLVAAVAGTRGAADPDFGAWSNLEDPFLVQTILALEEDVRAGSPAGRLYGECLGAALVARLLRRAAMEGGPKAYVRSGLPPNRLRRVLEYINDNLGSELSLLSLATVAEMGVDHFVRLFKLTTGLPPHQYVLRKRIERAQLLLANPALPLTEIASRVGFADQSHLSKIFRKLTGVPPGAFRKSVRR